MLTVAYTRASSSGQTMAAQRHVLTAWARAQGVKLRWYADQAESGVKRCRPAFDRMLEAVERGQVSTVVATRIDRLGRSAAHLLETMEALQARGVRLVFTEQSIDSGSVMGRCVLGILASVAAMEREQLLERTDAGRRAAMAAGVVFGRPRVLDDAQRDQARSMLASGASVSAVARVLGVGRATVRRGLAA